jgi:DNA (cytosine-5)-methyltransferase 1
MMMELRVNDFFCGAGGMGLGFKQAGYRLSGAWDFDKWAVESYGNNVSPKVKQADITLMKGEEIPYADVWTFGFPCQDLSVAGKQAGMIKGETRSGLFFEVMRLLEEVTDKPKVIMAENVKGLKKYLPELEEEYNRVGYRMYVTDQNKGLFNSKYWGVPQNRERYFVVGVRNDIEKEFIFPYQQTDYVPKLSSILEENVDEKYYIDDEKAAKIIEQAREGLKVKQATKKGYDIAKPGDSINIAHPNSKTRRGRVGKQVAQTLMTSCEQVVVEPLNGVHACITPDRVDRRQNGRRAKPDEEEMFTLTSQDRHGVIEPKINVVGMLDMKGQENIRRVYDTEGLSPTLTTSEGGHRQPKILVVGELDINAIEHNKRVYDEEGIAPTCPTGASTHITKVLQNYRVRKLTPREYARLQGFPDDYEFLVSNSQLYKQFGNAVTVNVAKALAESIKEFLEG